MSAETLLIWIIVGAVAGWLASIIVRGSGFGLVGDTIVGVIGAFVGGWLFGVLNIHVAGGLLGTILEATIGAVFLLLVVRVLRSA